jgi:hypothetical protein
MTALATNKFRRRSWRLQMEFLSAFLDASMSNLFEDNVEVRCTVLEDNAL